MNAADDDDAEAAKELDMPIPTCATDSAARPQWKISGALLIATAIATVVAVVGRVAADADQETLAQSLAYIRVNGLEYGVGGAARLVSGATLIAAALLMRTWIIRERFATSVVPALFIGSGALTAISGACAIALVVSVSGGGSGGILVAEGATTPFQETAAMLRVAMGKVGFAFAGLALIAAARYQWRVGGAFRYVAPVSLVLGIAMQLIFIDAATIAHRITGPAFVLWLLVVGAMLVSGRTERLFEEFTGRGSR